jgi:predicted nuclease with TOPRIM domain
MTIQIERIEIVTPIHGRTGTVMAQRVETVNGRTTYLEPIDLKVGFDGSELPQEVQDALAGIDAQQQATIAALTTERGSLQSQLTAITTELDTALSEKSSLQTQLDSANAELAEVRSDKAAIDSENDQLQASLDSANERITTLESRITELTAEPEVPIVSRRQARLALLQMNLLEAVEASVAQSPKAVQIEYEGDIWRRDNPTLIAMATALGMNTEQIDQFFALASTK